MSAPTLDEMPDLLTAREVATLLRVSISTVSKWSKDGELEAIRLGVNGFNLRFRREDIAKLLQPRPIETPAADGSAA